MKVDSQELLDFLSSHVVEYGYSPSYREIADHFHIGSTRTVGKYLLKLEQDGLVQLSSGKKRAIKILSHKVVS